MKPWVVYAFVSMVFAGLTGVIAKRGMEGISGELGLTLRTGFVFLFVLGFGFFAVSGRELAGVRKENLLWLGFSAVATAVSWVFYYKALKEGQVSTVALIDKASGLIAVLLAALILKEEITLRTALGALLVVGGLWLVSFRK